jgi:lysozyme
MKVNKEGIELLHHFESCKLEAYECPASLRLPKEKKFWTIGWGNTFYADGSKVKEGDVITQQMADRLFEVILSGFESQARKAITSKVNDNQFSAFTSALYNIGAGGSTKGGLIKLKNGNPSTLLRKINANPSDPTIRDEFMKWVSKRTAFERGLTRRRKAEADLYFS